MRSSLGVSDTAIENAAWAVIAARAYREQRMTANAYMEETFDGSDSEAGRAFRLEIERDVRAVAPILERSWRYRKELRLKAAK